MKEQIDQEIAEQIPEDNMQAMAEQGQSTDPNAQPQGQQTVGEQALEQPTPNPLPDEANPADDLNALFNAQENPMAAMGG